MRYRSILIDIPRSATEEQVEAVYRALGQADATVRIPFGDSIRDAKLVILNAEGKITGAQG